MGKLFFLIGLLSFFLACGGTEQPAKNNNGEKILNQDVNKSQLTSGLSKNTIPKEKKKEVSVTQLSQQINIHGVKQEGVFKLYSKVLGEGYYNGQPKIEILDDNGQVTKSIDVLENVTLFEESELEFQFNGHQGMNYFNVKVKNDNNPFRYVNTKLFPKPSFSPFLLLEVSYKVQYEAVLCMYTYYALEPGGLGLFGSESEIVVIDTTGDEIGRTTVEGQIYSTDITEDHKFLYVSTGGQINEDAFHPYASWRINLENNNIDFHRKGEKKECFSCWTVGNLGVMLVEESCSKSFQLLELWIFDHQSNKIFKPDMTTQCPKYSEVRIFEDYCECYTKDGSKQKFYYKRDFQSEKF